MAKMSKEMAEKHIADLKYTINKDESEGGPDAVFSNILEAIGRDAAEENDLDYDAIVPEKLSPEELAESCSECPSCKRLRQRIRTFNYAEKKDDCTNCKSWENA